MPVSGNELANKSRYRGLAAGGNFQCALGSELDAWSTARLALGPMPRCFTPLYRLLLFNKGSAKAFKVVPAARDLRDARSALKKEIFGAWFRTSMGNTSVLNVAIFTQAIHVLPVSALSVPN
jgi:hypothetical protein